MAYIGTPVQQALTKVTSQSFNGTGSQTVFTLSRAVNTGEELEVFVNNVQQEPGVGKSYTATGTTLTFDAAPASGTGNVYVIYRGLAEVTRRLEHDPNAALAATTGTLTNGLTVDANGATVATFDRATSDGTIIDLRKDGTTVGSIGVAAGDNLYIASTAANHGGIYMNDTGVLPMSGGSVTDNTRDLGGASNRWNDLFLGGGVYLGGTGSANHLDDYEEGTWTATHGGNDMTTDNGNPSYVKIGRLVTVCADVTSATGSSTTNQIGGLPFAPVYPHGTADVSYVTGSSGAAGGYVSGNATTINFIQNGGTSGASISAGDRLIFKAIYYTDA